MGYGRDSDIQHGDHIHPKFKRRGIMTALVRHAVETCFRFRRDRVYVEASICARPLFEKVGFEVVRERVVKIGEVELLNFEMELLKNSAHVE